jgi:iron complex transport system substrate-binding protein
VGVAACGTDPGVERAERAPDTDDVVVDGRGHRLSTSTPRARVVSLVPSVTEIVVALGGAGRLVGRTRFDEDPRLVDVRSVGGAVDPNVEAILDVRPDLVVTWADVGADALTARLESLGLHVYAASVGSIADFHRHTAALGALLGRVEAADSLTRRVENGLAAARPRDPVTDPPVVLFVLWPQPLMTSGRGTFVDELIELAGGRGAFADLAAPWPTVSFESVLERDPDLILVASENEGEVGPVPRWIERDARWRGLEAVREGRVHRVDADLFNRPGPGMVRAASELAGLLRPLLEGR